jgi:C4-dicarboxylate transporter DctQ subunit
MTSSLKWLDYSEDAVAGIFLALGLGVVLMEVVARGMLSTSFIWSEEISRYTLIWMTYFGASAAVRSGEHIRVTVILTRLSSATRRVVELVAALACLVFALAVVRYGIAFINDTRTMGLISADSNLPAPIWVFQSIIPIGYALIALRSGQRLLRIWTGAEELSENEGKF